MKKLVVLTGAGISAESGISTFRDSGGLWEQYNVMDVAHHDSWEKNPALMLKFYNERRQQLKKCLPNDAHKTLKYLEDFYDVHIITQNVDNLHERAGSANILHLHGELTKARSSFDENLVYDIGYKDIIMGDLCEKGYQLRPHIVWFGENVPNISIAHQICSTAYILVIIGTSLNVYPASEIIHSAPENIPVYVIDPNDINIYSSANIFHIKEKAVEGVKTLIKKLIK